MKEIYVCVTNNCPTCHALKKKLKMYLSSNQEIEKITNFVEDDHPFFKKNAIMAFPTVLIFEKENEVDRFYGNKSLEYLKENMK